MTLRDKIAAIINECLLHDDDQVSDYIYCQSYTGKELADEINAALPDYDAQQARIKELEAVLIECRDEIAIIKALIAQEQT
tara:strand:+ start:335 stop:577 length:243 start_codon:yes stop_codon:yes gene_type:complete